MAQRETLVLETRAATELLASDIARGSKALNALAQSGESASQRIERATARAALKFGPFAKAAGDASAQISGSFKGALSEVERIADRMVKSAQSGTGLDVGAKAAREAAQAARERANSIRLLEEAARRQAGAEGQANVATQAYIITLEQARDKAAAYAHQLDLEAGALERLEIELRQNAGAQSAFNTTQAKTAQVSGNARMGMQQLGYQLGDVATMFALGARPMQIFASQIGQVTQAVQMMSGGTSKLAAFLGGPWGIAITTAVIALSPFISNLFEAEDAAKKVDFASHKLGDAQSILASVMDRTTGKVRAQKDALIALARAQILAGQIQARAEMAAARNAMGGITRLRPHITAGFGGGLGVQMGRGIEADIVEAFRDRTLSADEAVRGLDSLRRTKHISEEAFLKAAKAVTDYAVSSENLKAFEGAERMLRGKGTAEDRRNFVEGAGGTKSKGGGDRGGGPTAEETMRRFQQEEIALTQRSLSALRQLALSTEESAELDMRGLEWSRIQHRREIEADEHYSQAQKAELLAAVERLSQYEREIVERRKSLAIAQGDQSVAEEIHSGNMARLELQQGLARTDAERRRIALEILEADVAYRRAKLEAVLASEHVAEVEKRVAREALKNLDAEYGSRQRDVLDRTAGPLERYKARLQDAVGSAASLRETMENAAARGLGTLEDGLVGVISGTEKASQAFKRMAASILADLARIAIQKTILNALGGVFGLPGKSGPANLLPPGYAAGGRISGPGTGTSDSILARLSSGEFVVNAAATSKHLALLQAINDNRLPRFAYGGLVAPRLPMRSAPAMHGQASHAPLSITINAPGATQETVSMIRREIASAAPAIVNAATQATVRQATRRRIG